MEAGIHTNQGIVTIGLEDQVKKIEKLRTSDPTMAKLLNAEIRTMLRKVRDALSKQAKTGLQMNSDTRQAYKAVQHMVYKRIFGGNVNILQRRKAGEKRAYDPPRKLVAGQRGGNRRKRSDRTKDLQEYYGADLGFVLRFLNAGTEGRYAGFGRNGRNEDERNKFILKTGGMGWRGRIKPRNWFGNASQAEMEKYAGELDAYIDNIIMKIIS